MRLLYDRVGRGRCQPTPSVRKSRKGVVEDGGTQRGCDAVHSILHGLRIRARRAKKDRLQRRQHGSGNESWDPFPDNRAVPGDQHGGRPLAGTQVRPQGRLAGGVGFLGTQRRARAARCAGRTVDYSRRSFSCLAPEHGAGRATNGTVMLRGFDLVVCKPTGGSISRSGCGRLGAIPEGSRAIISEGAEPLQRSHAPRHRAPTRRCACGGRDHWLRH